jgi:hypothetical protein
MALPRVPALAHRREHLKAQSEPQREIHVRVKLTRFSLRCLLGI